MILDLFSIGRKGLIYGDNARRISCDQAGVLNIGNTAVDIEKDTDVTVPVLFNGSSGIYKATFTNTSGDVYKLDNVTVYRGRIKTPSKIDREYAELRARVESLEALCIRMEEKIVELDNIFDTDSLNFLIK